MLETRGLTRLFGDNRAVDALDLTVRPGGLTGFVGGNGAGKTTTMRMIMGILDPTAGEVYWKGHPVTRDDRARFGYMPEERGLYPKQPVLSQLVYLGRLHGMTAAAARRAGQEFLERFGLAERANDPLESLSLGNQQRVQIAAAVMSTPIALILDEPFSGLDPDAVDSMADLLREQAARGVPVLFSSHQLDLVERICDDLVVLSSGRVVADGPGRGPAPPRPDPPPPRRGRRAVRRGRRRRLGPRRPWGGRGRRRRAGRGPRAGRRRRVRPHPARGAAPRVGPRAQHHRPQPQRDLPGGHGMSTDTTTRTSQDVETPEAPRTSGQAVWPVVMMREIVVKLRDRNFVVGTLITLVLIAGALGLNVFLSGKSDEVTAVVTGDGARAVMEQVGQVADQRDDDMLLTVTEAPDAAAVESAVRDEKADVGLIHTATDGGWSAGPS